MVLPFVSLDAAFNQDPISIPAATYWTSAPLAPNSSTVDPDHPGAELLSFQQASRSRHFALGDPPKAEENAYVCSPTSMTPVSPQIPLPPPRYSRKRRACDDFNPPDQFKQHKKVK
ncbi:hypothetical protein D9757_015376 [Collybiopsis confluens]|nr:hypothetical protein D9757_015376 [Collybiopsis confluens]